MANKMYFIQRSAPVASNNNRSECIAVAYDFDRNRLSAEDINLGVGRFGAATIIGDILYVINYEI